MIQLRNGAILAALLLLLLPLLAVAAPADDSGPYFGLGFGMGMINRQPNLGHFESDVRAMAWAPSNVSMSSENKDSVGKMFFGWRFGPRVALEAGYFRGGDYEMAATVNDPAVVDETSGAVTTQPKAGRMTMTSSVQGLSYQVLVFAPTWKRLGFFGKFGGIQLRSSYECVHSGNFLSNSACPAKTGAARSQLLYGIGGGWQVADYLIRLDVDRIDSVYLPAQTSQNDLTMATLNIVLKF